MQGLPYHLVMILFAVNAAAAEPLHQRIDALLPNSGVESTDDATFLRRVYMDFSGRIPPPAAVRAFLADPAPDKRTRVIRTLLDDDVRYAEHWLTFWNDLLRNDYGGTGFITGGRKQISKWLYDALITNKPFDQFAGDLIAPPTAESRVCFSTSVTAITMRLKSLMLRLPT